MSNKTLVSKADLLQELVHSEVIDKRHQLRSIRTGMDYLCLASVCKRYPERLCHILVYQDDRCIMTQRTMLSLINVRTLG